MQRLPPSSANIKQCLKKGLDSRIVDFTQYHCLLLRCSADRVQSCVRNKISEISTQFWVDGGGSDEKTEK